MSATFCLMLWSGALIRALAGGALSELSGLRRALLLAASGGG